MGAALQAPDDALARQPEPPALEAAPTLGLPLVGAQSKERSHQAEGPGEAPGLHSRSGSSSCATGVLASHQAATLAAYSILFSGWPCLPARCLHHVAPQQGLQCGAQLCRVLPLAQAMQGQTGSAGRGA